MRASLTVVAVLVTPLLVIGCTQSPSSPMLSPSVTAASSAALDAKPGYEPSYYDGEVVMMNSIQVPQNKGPLEHAAADLYSVVYPPNHTLWPGAPQCNPCDHQGNGIDPGDFHDHVLDSIPSSPGHGEYNPLWHLFVILPADFSPAGQAAYAARLPMTSEEAIDDAIADGVATEVDTNFYFICAVVNANAGK